MRVHKADATGEQSSSHVKVVLTLAIGGVTTFQGAIVDPLAFQQSKAVPSWSYNGDENADRISKNK